MRKSILPWFYLVAAAGSNAAHAIDEGIFDYRQGEYFQAAKNLMGVKQAEPDKKNTAVVNYYLGRMRLYGYGLLKNNDAALRYINLAGEQGLLAAQQWLGKYYLYINKPDIALNWFKKAAGQADYSSQMYVTAAYLFGYGTAKNPDAARRYYIDLARAGNALAQYTLAMDFLNSRDKSNRKMGVIWLNKAAEKGYEKAVTQLGELYASGTGVTQDVTQAVTLLTKSAEQGSATAQLALAKLLADEKTTVYDAKMAFSWMQKAAAQNNIEAQLALSAFYKEGRLVPADEKLAEKWQETAKKNSDNLAKNPEEPAQTVALWLTQGKTNALSQTDYVLGGIYSAWQNKQALQENNYNPSPKMHRVGRQELYRPKFELASPKEIAITDYFDFLANSLNSAKTAHWRFPLYPIDSQIQALEDSQSYLLKPCEWVSVVDEGRCLQNYTDQVPANYLDEKMVGWETKANFQAVLTYLYYRAILGDANAQFKLGQLYEYGVGVAKNIEQAIIYYELAALQQDVRAEYNLGVLYLQGKTTPVDYKKGTEWMMDAAFKGNPYAQYVLGNLYENGLNDPTGAVVLAPNHEQARALLYLASANHYEMAQYQLAEFLSQETNDGLNLNVRATRTALIKSLYQQAEKAGIAEAILPAAFYEAIDADPAKQKHAFEVAGSFARSGNSLAALLLGILYERGIGVTVDEDEAMHWYQQAALNPVSEYILGSYYLEGKVLSQDVKKGRELLQKSADAGFSYANYNLALVKKSLNEPFLKELDTARLAGNSKAGLLLADYYLLQAKDPVKMQQAREIYQYFADKGDRNAQVKLAFLYDRGLGGQANLELAANWYRLAGNQGQPVAQYLLGLMYQMGKIGDSPDYAAAKKWYESAKSRYAPAAVALGFVLDTVDDNYRDALKNYELAVQKGDVIAQYNLGLMYEEGKGRAVSRSKAEQLYLPAAQRGFSPAMTQLAGLYFKGVNDGAGDPEKALLWYKKAAALGNREANYQLGLMAETGVGLALDFPSAVKFYQQAADLGDEKASMALARMYRYGLGVKKDLSHAADLYRSLAAANNAYAQYQLALLYSDGSLGEQKLEESKRLLNLASANGSTQATSRLLWISAQQESKLSFVEPVLVTGIAAASAKNDQAANLIYLEALSEWNRGDELSCRSLINRLVTQFPQYRPAKWISERLS